jgi:hypothetical protein
MWEDARSSVIFHVQGAQAMIKLRRPDQRNNKLGQAMYEFIRGFIVSLSIDPVLGKDTKT